MKEEKICPNIEEQFMFSTRDKEIRYDEFYKDENNQLKENDIFKLIGIKNKERFSLIGQGQEVYYDKNGVFNILDNIFKIELLEGNKNLFEMNSIENVIAYRRAKQELNMSKGTIEESIEEYNLGYKINNDSIFSRIYFSINKYEGLKFHIEITPSERDMNTKLNIYKEETVIANTDLNLFKGKTFKIDVNI